MVPNLLAIIHMNILIYYIFSFYISDCQPTESEQDVWCKVDQVLQCTNNILNELQQYKGAANEIREVSIAVIMSVI